MDFAQSATWLETKARELVRASEQDMPGGRHAFPPQVGLGYNAFWLRDYSYMLETCADVFTKKELVDACRLFVESIDEHGAGTDCVRFSGEPIYKPGFGTMGRNPVADGSQFTVNVAWATWQQTQDRELLARVLPALQKTMAAVPRNSTSGLVHIAPGEGQERCPYGFTDTIGKQGDVLFCSLLYIQASRRLAEMLRAAGEDAKGKSWDAEADRLTVAVRTVFWDEHVGLFRAATAQCREPDIWGSAFAVYLEVADEAQARRIGTYFRDHYAEICQRGQIRHLPGGVYWERGCARDTYQNGAYWATPTGWFVHALALVDAELARQTVVDLVQDFRERGVCEWVIGDRTQLPNYVASATLPLQGIRELAR
jgi:GH15 family glucan-1,4-alpha-glucosidase